jgi:hypothetical protein
MNSNKFDVDLLFKHIKSIHYPRSFAGLWEEHCRNNGYYTEQAITVYVDGIQHNFYSYHDAGKTLFHL